MPMLVIAGGYQALNGQPDGDSIRFYPTDPADWAKLPGPHKIETNAGGGAQTRFDGVDALETHYRGKGGGPLLHQPLGPAHAAADEVLAWLGFTNVVRDERETVTASEPVRVPGYLLSRSVDRNGRCVSFLFRGPAPAASGTEIFFSPDEMRESLNLRLIEQGFAYPTYYSKLFFDLRWALTEAAGAAREAGLGVWGEDDTATGFTLTDRDVITEQAVILPKLFRRLVDYLSINDGAIDLGGFAAYLAARDDRLFVLSTGQATGFDSVVEVAGQNVRMTKPPEDLVFIEA